MREALCRHCGNVDDLCPISGAFYCAVCRTCLHGKEYFSSDDNVCDKCYRDFFTVWTVYGPVIADVPEYVAQAIAWHIKLGRLRIWRYGEELMLQAWFDEYDERVSEEMSRQFHQFPHYPLLHLYARAESMKILR